MQTTQIEPGMADYRAILTETTSTGEHPELPIPFTVSLSDRKLDGKGLSLVGCSAVGLVDPAHAGKKALAILLFSFDGFVLSIPAEVIIRVPENAEPGRVKLDFADPAGGHLPQVRYILNSYIAGDIVSLGHLLSVPGVGAAKANPSQQKRGVGFRVGQFVRTAGLVALTLALIAAVALTVQTRVFTREELRPALVRFEGTDLRSPAAGQLQFLNADAQQGDVAFAVMANSGALLNVMMPCDCEIGDLALREGATLLAGEPVMALVDPGAGLKVDAVMSYEGIHAALSGATIELMFTDGRVVPATIDAGSAQDLMTVRPGDWTPVALTPETALSEADAGQLVRVQLHWPTPLVNGIAQATRGIFAGAAE